MCDAQYVRLVVREIHFSWYQADASLSLFLLEAKHSHLYDFWRGSQQEHEA
jgi:hypothetical protein